MESVLKSATFKQSLLAICVSCSYYCIGLLRGFSAPAIPSMSLLDPGLLPNKSIESWASSIPPLGAFFGSLMAAPIMHKFGRKITVLLSSPIWILAWILIATTHSWQVIILARFLSGISAGLTLPSAQIYVSECSDPHIRGVIGSLPAISMSLGILVSYILGTFVTWRELAWINTAFSIVLFLAVSNLPESPVWLLASGKTEKFDRAVSWLHLTVIPQNSTAAGTKLFSQKIIFSRRIILPLVIGLVILSLQQTSGIDSVIFFTVEIFRSAGSSLDGHYATIIVGLVQLLSNCASLFVVDRLGRKPLLIFSGGIMAISMGFMGTAFYLNSKSVQGFGYLPLGSLIVFMIGYSLGFGCIPFLLLGEIFPASHRSFLSSIAGSFNLGVMFIVIKTYHPLESFITTAGTFWAYSISCCIAIFFVITCVPETKGKDLDSISKLFQKKSDLILPKNQSHPETYNNYANTIKCEEMTSHC